MLKMFARRQVFTKLALACVISSLFLSPAALAAQAADLDLTELAGYEPPNEIIDDTWIDPAIRFGLDPEALGPAPEFDFTTLHKSTVLAAGMEAIPVDNDQVGIYRDRHIRVLQIVDTLQLEIGRINEAIVARQPELDLLLDQISRQETQIERLDGEIETYELAIAEFAISAFIGEDTSTELLFAEGSTDLNAGRIVTDEVRQEQRLQLSIRRDEVAQRETTIAGLEADLTSLREEMNALRHERAELGTKQGQAEQLTNETAARYQVALHERLPHFVADTDLPYVALNAYVIAARTLETEDPSCGIDWSMLAGIGRIESLHGYFGDSTLDINGSTTTDIRGLPLDGRILSGGEHLSEGASAPAATGRTEETTITVAPAPAPAEPAEGGDAPASADLGGGDQDTAPSVPAPAPVIKRLALILDTDDGVLDGDTTYDRAVGPMQFIPSTWRLYDADGNADEETDPQNIYDAALASARYLCAATTTMTTTEGEQRAYFAYNHDLDYSADVTAQARRYRNLLTIESPAPEELGDALYLGIAETADEEADELALLLEQLAALDLPDW